jgi:tetratricopeptide (TPR) repeat protein
VRRWAAGIAWAVLVPAAGSLGVVPQSSPSPARPSAPSLLDSAEALESALVEGRYRDARRLLEAAAESGRSPVPGEASLIARAAVEMRDWERAAALEPDRVPDGDRGSTWFAWGLAHARLAWPGARSHHTTRARQAAAVLDEMASRHGRSTRTEVRHLAVRAAIAAAEEERDEMAVILGRARTVDDLLVQAGLGADPVMALPELEGDLWLQVSRFRDAADAYRRALAQPGPARPRVWLGLARAHARLDAAADARAAAREAAALWHRADPDLAELAELRVLVWGR